MFITTIPSYTDLEGVGSFFWGDNATLGSIITTILPIIFIGAGIVLFIFILIGGFTLLTSGGNPKKMEKGSKILTNAVIGFLIVIASYWLAQIVQVIFGVSFL